MNPSSETQGPRFVLINNLQVIMDTQICQDLKICGMPTRCKKNLLKYINTLGPVPERSISVNPGIKCCSVFVFYIPTYCLG